MFSLFKKKAFFTPTEAATIVAAIKQAELLTSGEVRLYVETKCDYMDAMDKAKEIFYKLNMTKTLHSNGVLVYVATKDKQLAIYADQGIHQLVDNAIWQSTFLTIKKAFTNDDYVNGLVNCIHTIGQLLHQYFPYNNDDKNELPDEIIFGK